MKTINKKEFMLCDKITEENLHLLNGEYKANIKFDGERIVAMKVNDEVFLVNRADREKSFMYPEIAEELKKIDGSFIFDGEVITTDGKFNSLQHRVNLGSKQKIDEARVKYPIIYMVFDLIAINGEDLRNKKLSERIRHLRNNFNFDNLDKIKMVEYKEINEKLQFAKENKCEGIVIKNMNGLYEGRRSRNWLKLKLFKEAEFKAVTYTENNAGIRLEDEFDNAVQCSGNQSDEVRNIIDEKGFVWVVVQYLEKTKNNKLRFISFKEVVK